MRQPVSRNTFDRLLGYLGVHLQEGAPLVDAAWNEAVDVQQSLLRDAIRDAGLDGTAGIELRIDALDGGGLVARGGPGRFYCNGLPVPWPTTRRIAHGLPPGQPRTIYLDAWVGVIDSLDLPDLDDPGLGSERGTFRTVVRSRIRIGHAHERRTNLLLTVRSTYSADRNALYRVELVEVRAHDATILWDGAAASVTALVTQRAEAGATEVALGSTDGFEVGHLVRFEAAGHPGRGLYRVTGKTAGTIAIEGHDCTPVSLVDCAGLSSKEDGPVLEVVLEDDPRCTALHELRPGTLVTELPANLGKPSPPGGWRVLDIEREQPSSASMHPRQPCPVRIRLGRNGLRRALDPWDPAQAAPLALHVHPFQTCVEVCWPDDAAAQQLWTPGMFVQIGVEGASPPDTALQFVDTDAASHCRPGGATVQLPERRRVARIIHHRHGANGEPLGPTMTLILDNPLSSEHEAGAPVVPAHPIRARRFEGHACAVPIDVVDPAAEPSRDDPTSPYDLGGRQPLVPTGLSLLLAIETEGAGHDATPIGAPGDGWTFAARAGGWVERPIFAPVDENQRGSVALADVQWREGALELIDRRPVPAPHAHHGWLADIADVADQIAEALSLASAEDVAAIARLADGLRAQRELVGAIRALADELPDGASTRARDRLRAAVDAVHDAESPSAPELSRIASAMERLCCTAAPEPPPEDRADRGEPEPAKPVEPPGEPPVAAPPPPPPLNNAHPDDGVDIVALPTRLIQSTRTVTSSQRRRWPTLRDVPASASLPRGQERRLAEVVESLLTETAEIGRRARAGEDRAALQAALDDLWRARFDLDKLPRAIRIDDAVALHDRQRPSAGGKP